MDDTHLPTFVRAALRRPLVVATPFPTSAALARRMVEDIAPDEVVVELGPGTGAITRFLAPRPDYLGLELDPSLATALRARLPTMRVVNAPAEELAAYVPTGSVDVVLSSLPWSVLPVATSESVLDAVTQVLGPHGRLTTYLCVHTAWFPGARGFLRALRRRFPRVRAGPIVWRNVPPAVLLRAGR
jgi:phosphatidylethanolamine/phosphatidyl-N-methylethanolamine N-methyltransferase